MNHVIYTCKSTKLRRKLLETVNLCLKDLLEIGRLHDSVELQLNTFERSANERDDINFVNNKKKQNRSHKHEFRRQSNDRRKSNDKECWFCGGQYPHKNKCPAAGKRCNICQKLNHFAKMCLSKKDKKTENIRSIKESEIHNSGERESEIRQTIYSILGEKQPLKYIKINGTPVEMKLDTGASVNILDEKTFSNLKGNNKLYPYRKS